MKPEPRTYPARPLTGVGAVVLKDSQILLVKRKHPPRSHLWTLPGGLVEIGETVRDAAVREISEECGIEVRLQRLVDVVDYVELDSNGRVKYHYILVDFEARYLRGTLQPSSEILEARWFAGSEILSLPLPDITRDFFRKHYFHKDRQFPMNSNTAR